MSKLSVTFNFDTEAEAQLFLTRIIPAPGTLTGAYTPTEIFVKKPRRRGQLADKESYTAAAAAGTPRRAGRTSALRWRWPVLQYRADGCR